MRLVRYILMVVMIASVIALPGHTHLLPSVSDHHVHTSYSHDSGELLRSTDEPSARNIAASHELVAARVVAADPDCDGAVHHGDNCCCINCAPTFTLPDVAGLQVRVASELSSRPIYADSWRVGALLGRDLRPPISG